MSTITLHGLIRKMAKKSRLSKSETTKLKHFYDAGELTGNVILEAGIEKIYGFLRPKDLLGGINRLCKTFKLQKLSTDELVKIGRSSMTKVVERYLNAFEKEARRKSHFRRKK